MQRLKKRPLPLHKIHNGRFGNHFPVYADTLAEIHQVRRSIKARPVTGRLQQGRQRMRHAALSVRSSHMYGPEPSVRMSEMPVQLPRIEQALFISGPANLLE